MNGSGLGWEYDQYTTRYGTCGTCGRRWKTCDCASKSFRRPWRAEDEDTNLTEWAPSDEAE